MEFLTIRTFLLSTISKFFQNTMLVIAKPEPVVELTETPPQEPQPASRVSQDLTMVAIGFCLASAIDVALLTVQIKPQLLSTLPLLSMLIFLAFGSLLVGRFIYSCNKLKLAAQVLERFGIFFAAMAFCYAINIPFSHSLKCTTWAIFAFSVLAIFVCNLVF